LGVAKARITRRLRLADTGRFMQGLLQTSIILHLLNAWGGS
jgi:hypothetical protein